MWSAKQPKTQLVWCKYEALFGLTVITISKNQFDLEVLIGERILGFRATQIQVIEVTDLLKGYSHNQLLSHTTAMLYHDIWLDKVV